MDELINTIPLSDNHVDDHVDNEIQQYLNLTSHRSFFMFAGAGSGKTRSLINTLDFLDKEQGTYLAEHGKQVAVITYTNAACDEISRRLQYKPIFLVSTTHSFLWELIKNFQTDIKAWVKVSIENEITDLLAEQSKGRDGDAAIKRNEKIAQKRGRLEKINNVKRFSYNPNSDNVGFDSLSHDEVLKMGSAFIATEETMQQILVNRYPILLIDESQDTKKELVDSLLQAYERHKSHWIIGMFGDTMQKIYMDGKDRLEEAIPRDWVFPVKVMNHRSAKRIVDLANAIRAPIDDKKQRARTDAAEGVVHLFVTDSQCDKEKAEKEATEQMAEIASDPDWKTENGYKSLILEHHMAASRFFFSELFTSLNESKEFDSSLRKGDIAELSFLANIVSPLVKAHKKGDEFEVAKIVRKNSPLLSQKAFVNQPERQQELLEQAESSTESLLALWNNGAIPSCLDVLRNVQSTNLFEIGERVSDILDDSYNGDNAKVIALKTALMVSFDELERYAAYVSEQTKFATHQGIKGLEFPRVMVVLDDAEATGNWFSYEKLFGAKERSTTDLKNEKEGKDTSLLRTTRLFYVACTRAKDSLAVVAYSKNPEVVKRTAILNGWFSDNEITIIESVHTIESTITTNMINPAKMMSNLS